MNNIYIQAQFLNICWKHKTAAYKTKRNKFTVCTVKKRSVADNGQAGFIKRQKTMQIQGVKFVKLLQSA